MIEATSVMTPLVAMAVGSVDEKLKLGRVDVGLHLILHLTQRGVLQNGEVVQGRGPRVGRGPRAAMVRVTILYLTSASTIRREDSSSCFWATSRYCCSAAGLFSKTRM